MHSRQEDSHGKEVKVARNLIAFGVKVTCKVCDGTGRVLGRPCPGCDGEGSTSA